MSHVFKSITSITSIDSIACPLVSNKTDDLKKPILCDNCVRIVKHPGLCAECNIRSEYDNGITVYCDETVEEMNALLSLDESKEIDKLVFELMKQAAQGHPINSDRLNLYIEQLAERADKLLYLQKREMRQIGHQGEEN